MEQTANEYKFGHMYVFLYACIVIYWPPNDAFYIKMHKTRIFIRISQEIERHSLSYHKFTDVNLELCSKRRKDRASLVETTYIPKQRDLNETTRPPHRRRIHHVLPENTGPSIT